jgi:hypothetical protein
MGTTYWRHVFKNQKKIKFRSIIFNLITYFFLLFLIKKFFECIYLFFFLTSSWNFIPLQR